MRVLFINVVCGIYSTGKIVCELAEKYEQEGHEVKVAYGRHDSPEKYRRLAVRIGSDWDVYHHALMARLTDRQGFFSRRATEKFLKWADDYNPDFLWLHNLVGYYINLEMLFGWIKSRPNMKVYWTLHSCWEITGHCVHFTICGCDKWKTHCHHCPQKNRYPASFIDNSYRNYEDKRRLFTGVRDMTLITPSQWLADLVKQSYLKDYPVEVRYNTIDTEIFRPRESDFRARFGLDGKKIVLGVASTWEERKGLGDFVRLAAMLDPEKYAVVLVGLTPRQVSSLPGNVATIDLKDGKITQLQDANHPDNSVISTTWGGLLPTAYTEPTTRFSLRRYTRRRMCSSCQATRRTTLLCALRPKPAVLLSSPTTQEALPKHCMTRARNSLSRETSKPSERFSPRCNISSQKVRALPVRPAGKAA